MIDSTTTLGRSADLRTGGTIAALLVGVVLAVVAGYRVGWLYVYGALAVPLIALGLVQLALRFGAGVVIGGGVVLAVNGIPGVDLRSDGSAFSVEGSGLAVPVPPDLAPALLIVFGVLWSWLARSSTTNNRAVVAFAYCGGAIAGWWLLVLIRTLVATDVPFGLAVLHGRDFLYFGLMLIVLPRCINGSKDALNALAILGGLAAIYGVARLAEVGAGFNADWLAHPTHRNVTDGADRVYSDLARTLAIGVGVGIAIAIAGTTRRVQLLGGAVLALSTAALALQYTRALYIGVTVAIVAALAIVFITGRPAVRIRVLVTGGAVVGAVLALVAFGVGPVESVMSRLQSITSDVTGGGTVGYRVSLAQTVLSTVGEDWLWGLGFQHPNAVTFSAIPGGELRDADLGIPSGIALVGAVGVALLIVPVGIVAVISSRRLLTVQRGKNVCLAFPCLVWSVTVLVTSMTLPDLFSFPGLVVTGVLCSVSAQLASSQVSNESLE